MTQCARSVHSGDRKDAVTKTLAIAQFGGPTAVINSSLWGFFEGAGACEVLAAIGGPAGLLRGDLRPLRRSSEKPTSAGAEDEFFIGSTTALLPGAWLGAGRYPFSDRDLNAIVTSLVGAGIDGLGLIGGNGTMHVANELDRRAVALDLGLNVIGVPKTVDNDLVGIDHAPGYLSAARFLIQAVRDLDLDHEAMSSIEQVRIIETLGRNTGWLALATTAARAVTGGAPHLVYVPERPFDEEAFLGDVSEAVDQHGRALVVVAEGIAASITSPFDHALYDRPISGGVGHRLAQTVEHRLGFGARGEVLGLIQRCASWSVSDLDRQEAYVLGREAARLLCQDKSGVMVALAERQLGESSAASPPITVPLVEVAGRTRPVPRGWVPQPSGDATELLAWLEPLLAPADAPDDELVRRDARSSTQTSTHDVGRL